MKCNNAICPGAYKQAPVFLCSERSCSRLAEDKQPISSQQIQQIQKLAENLAYGSISIVFQDGKIVQIDKNEKIRLQK